MGGEIFQNLQSGGPYYEVPKNTHNSGGKGSLIQYIRPNLECYGRIMTKFVILQVKFP